MKENLFEDFSAISQEEWIQKIEKDLKGRSYDKLIWKTNNGFDIPPLFTAESAPDPIQIASEKSENTWETALQLAHPDIDLLKKIIDYSVQNDVDSFDLDLHSAAPNTRIASPGVNVSNSAELAILLELIRPHGKSVFIEPGKLGFPVGIALAKYVQKHPGLTGGVAFDPFSLHNFWGYLPKSSVWFDQGAALCQYANKHLPGWKTLRISSESIQESGASQVQEIAFTLSMLSDLMDQLTERGVTVQEILKKLYLQLTVGTSFFPEIAKIRAFHLLLDRFIESWPGGEGLASNIPIHVRTSQRFLDNIDPETNLLRATTSTMSAILGGVDRITIRPHDSRTELQSLFTSSTAKNISLVLREESYLDRVKDPAAGAWYIDVLTEKMVDEAWNLFLEVESKGGYLEAFKQNWIKTEIEGVDEKVHQKIRNRSQSFIGINNYPRTKAAFEETFKNHEGALADAYNLITETIGISDTLQQLVQQEGSTEINVWADGLTPKDGFESIFSAIYSETAPVDSRLLLSRVGDEYEAARILILPYSYRYGAPTAFLFTFGPAGMRTARANFSQNLLGCGGIGVIENNFPNDIEQAFAQLVKEDPRIVVLCSSDEEYQEKGIQLITKIKAQFPGIVILLAGKPEDQAPFKDAGVHDFMYMKLNAVEFFGRMAYHLAEVDLPENK